MRYVLIICVFCAGANFERLLQGGTDAFFGSRWLLAAYVIAGLAVGLIYIPSIPSTDGATHD